MLSKVIGLQFCRSNKSESSLGIRVITPLRCEMESSPTSKAWFRLFIRSVPITSKKCS